nr:hypothetical protein BaRGS_029532 [Batillaria attramentaria]
MKKEKKKKERDRKRGKEEKKPERRPFDRDQDLKANQFDDAQRSQTPEDILQHCPAHDARRHQTWPEGAELQVQFQGGRHYNDPENTVGFVMAT